MTVHRYASSLPGSAGWVLLELLETPRNGIGQLMDALNLGERTIERAVADLARLGLCVRDNRAVTLAHDALERCTHPVASPAQTVNAVSTEPVQNLSQDVNTISTSLATELTPIVLDDSNSIPSRARASEYLGVSSSSVDLEDLKPKPTPRSKLTTSTAIQKTKSPVAPRAVSSWRLLLEKPDFHAPPWLDLDAWLTWLGDLQDRKISVTQGALRVQLDKLKTLSDAGLEQQAVVDTAISRGWKTVGELDWFKPSTQSPGAARAGKPSLRAEDQFERLVREMGLTDAPPTITAQARAALPRGEN